MTTVKPKISEVLQRLLSEKGLSVSELARRTSMPQPTIQRIVSGARTKPHRKTLESLASFFSITLDQLSGIEPRILSTKSNITIKQIPIINCIQASNWPLEIAENYSEHVVIDKEASQNTFALKMPDFSMEPLIAKESILIIDPEKPPQYRSFVAVKLKNHPEVLIRQLIKDAGNCYIRPLSRDFEQLGLILLNPSEDLIIGVVVEVRLRCEE